MADYTQLNRIASACLKEGNYKAALSYYKAVMDSVVKRHGSVSLRAAESYTNIGIVYYQCDNRKKAYEFFRKGEDIFREELGDDHPYTKKIGTYLDLIESKAHQAREKKKEKTSNEPISRAFERMCMADQETARSLWVNAIISAFSEIDPDFEKYQLYYKKQVFKRIDKVMVEDQKAVNVLDFEDFESALRERAYKAAMAIIKRETVIKR